jgi:EAL domain-containing protein (putative c-di-GMP-specific phosphodiesterase class I)
MTTPYFQNLSLETGIHKALENGEFQLVYQPQINIKSGEIVGAEALLRWNHPEHGLMTPAEFIPFAEETGMIVDIGHWVLRNACAELKRWRDAGLPEIRMSINMSARQLAEKNIVKYVSNILRDYGIPGHCLEIEITENTIMSDMDSIIHKLKNISKRGVYIAIDDFGTGYSSLSYLHKLPIHTLKIDRTFIKEVNMKQRGKSIVNTIVAMVKGLNLNVIAEGVETQQQLDYLQEIDCNEAQGFLFCKPLPSDVVVQLLIQEPYAVPDSNSGLHGGRHRTH